MRVSAFSQKREALRRADRLRQIAAVSLTVSFLFLMAVLVMYLRVIPADGAVRISLAEQLHRMQMQTAEEDLDPADVHTQRVPPLQSPPLTESQGT